MGIADGIALGVLQGDGCQQHVSLGTGRRVFVLRDAVAHEELLCELQIVLWLQQVQPIHLPQLHLSWGEVGVHFQHAILAILLLGQDGQSGCTVAGGNDPIRHFSGDYASGLFVAFVTEGDKIPKRGHTVSTTSPCIRRGNGGQSPQIVHHAHLFFVVVQLMKGHCCSCRTDVLEGCSSRGIQSLLQICDEPPGIKRVQQIDETRRAGKNLEG
mmetsp:Transcript_74520/g.125618  ORF Transcript_74520/g.125618 Transcript_74520/m.125618 type:complete len:213 (-) Transcript_74520:732-1370(-)